MIDSIAPARLATADPSRVADASAVVGGGCWLALVALVASGVVPVAAPMAVLAVALAMLVLVPVVARLADDPLRNGSRSRWYAVAVALGFPGAVLGVAALFLPTGVVAAALALPWLVAAVALAGFGLRRGLPRGLRSPAELAVSVGLVYLPVGGAALVLHRLGASVGFSPLLVLLTAVHFHYAGCVLPAFAGFAARSDAAPAVSRRRGAILGTILLGPALIAVGITFSPLVEVVAATVFAVAVAAFAGYGLRVVGSRVEGVPARTLLAISWLSVVVSMGFAVGYAASRYAGTGWVTLPAMLRSHGVLNAVGFGLAGAIGWRLAAPELRGPPLGLPLSRLTAHGRVGADFFDRTGATADAGDPAGMVDSFDAFARRGFDPGRVHPDVRAFYERTREFDLVIHPDWRPGFRAAAGVYTRLAARVEQMNFPTAGRDPDRLGSRILPVDDARDGRSNVRAWVRVFEETGAAIYAAAYATHVVDGETYMNIAFPLPGTNLTSVLRVEALDAGGSTGVRLSTRSDGEPGDEGIYLRTPLGPLRLPLAETIDVWPADAGAPTPSGFAAPPPDARVLARHEMWLLGRPFLTLDYHISPADAAAPDDGA